VTQTVRARPTIIDVARAAGVSKSTVSRVLQGEDSYVKDETREQVQKAIRRLGFERNTIASSLRTDRTYMVMLITPDISNPFWAELARGFQDTFEKQNYSVVLGNSDWDGPREKEFLGKARRSRFDGIAINPTSINKHQLRELHIPAVILGVREDFSTFDRVGSDTYNGVLTALDYLYDLGHRRIAFIRGKHESGRGYVRLRAYQEFCKRRNLKLDDAHIPLVPFDLEGGRRAMEFILAAPRKPTALFASNDILAMGAMQFATERGVRIPDDLSIVGMDDIYPAAMLSLPLTTMAKPKYDIGCQAAKYLLDRIDGNAPPNGRRCVLPCRLIARQSTAPPAA
jgi:DNA-binding LacI/PurR family transcriptional regulator